MKERPILYTGPMVRAIIEGRKRQTRRIVKDNSILGRIHPAVSAIVHRSHGWFGFEASEDLKRQYITTFPFHTIRCPYGEPGDRLWVRETFALVGGGDPGIFITRADYPHCVPSGLENVPADAASVRWTPSIFMPRRLSRITLEIISIRVERLNDISEEDAWAEGCIRGERTDNGGYFPAWEPDPSGIWERGWDCAKEWYADLWEDINGPGSWAANPWVWVIEFQNISKLVNVSDIIPQVKIDRMERKLKA